MAIDLSEIELRVFNGFLSFADANNETAVTTQEVADSIDLPKSVVHYNYKKLIYKRLIKIIRNLGKRGSLKRILPNAKNTYREKQEVQPHKSNDFSSTSRDIENRKCPNYDSCQTWCAFYDHYIVPCQNCNGSPAIGKAKMQRFMDEFKRLGDE